MGIRLRRSQLRYCIKVGIAAGLGYALTQGADERLGDPGGARRRDAAVEDAQVESTLRLGLNVLSCALRGPDADSVQDLRHRINSMCSHGQVRS